MHLGAKPDAGNAYSQNREQELWDSFRDIITICNQKKTDLLLIAGDLFHRQPLLRELKEMNSILEMLEQTEVVMIAGNHDHIRKNSYYRTFTWAPHVHMICSQEMSCVELDRIQTAVYGCSYHSREILEPLYDHAVPEGRQKYEILLAHGGDEKHIPIKSSQIMTLGYDYAAFGHIHKPQAMGREMVRYAGSILKYSFSEIYKEAKAQSNISLSDDHNDIPQDDLIKEEILQFITDNKLNNFITINFYGNGKNLEPMISMLRHLISRIC